MRERRERRAGCVWLYICAWALFRAMRALPVLGVVLVLGVLGVRACGPGEFLNSELAVPGCSPCPVGFFKSGNGEAGCVPCSAGARGAATCEGATTADCLCADAAAQNAGVAPGLCGGELYVPCPHTWAGLFAFLDADAAQCINIMRDAAVRELVRAQPARYFFDEHALCAPDASAAREAVGNETGMLYRVRRECAGGSFAVVASDREDSACVPCAPGTFLRAGDARGACYAKTRVCAGAEYDDEPVDTRTQDTQCVADVLAAQGLIPGGAGGAQYAFSAPRRASLYTESEREWSEDFCSSSPFSHAQPVLLGLWERAGLALPAAGAPVEGLGGSDCLLACDAGYALGSGDSCAPCAPGTAKREAGMDAVRVHDAHVDGAYALGPGRWYTHVACAACAAGTFAAKAGQAACAECGAGFYCPAGASGERRCEEPGRAVTAGSACDPRRDFLTGACARGSTRANCARCPFNATLDANRWAAYGVRAHCQILCPEHTELRADWEQHAGAPCVPCEPERPCMGRCQPGWRVHEGACKRCAADEATLREACPGAGPDAVVDATCADGVAAACTLCAAPRGMRALRNASDPARCLPPQCDTRVGPGEYSYVDAAAARALLAFGDASALPAGECVRTRIRARAECSHEFAAFNAETNAVECAPPPPCPARDFFDLVYSNASRGLVCACTAGFFAAGGACALCPPGTTSLAGTLDARGCFCKPGFARFGAQQCLPCASVGSAPQRQYCPGGVASYAAEVAPFRLAGLAHDAGAGARCPYGADGAHPDVCRCMPNSSVAAGIRHASAAGDCEFDAGVFVDAGGAVQACKPRALSRWVRANGRVCASECVAHAVREPGGACACAPGFEELHGACVCRRGTLLAGGACQACPRGFYCPPGGGMLACDEDKTSLPNASAVTDCRCRAGWYWVREANYDAQCRPCQDTKYCQPACNSSAEGNYGLCLCPDGFLCTRDEPTQPRACPQGWRADVSRQACVEGDALHLWHNGLAPAREPGAGLAPVNPALAVLLPSGSQAGAPKRGMYVLADAAWRCRAGEVLVQDRAGALFGNFSSAFACRALGTRVNTGAAVPSMLYAPARADRALVHELFPGERWRALGTALGHLAWNQVLACAGAGAAGPARSEIDACHACPEHGVALERAGLDAGGLLQSDDVLVALEPGVHAVWALADGHTCVGAAALRAPRALQFAVHCLPPAGAAYTHLRERGEYASASASAAERIWTSFVVAHWQHTPARAHGARVVLSVLCFADAHAALAVHDVSGGMSFVQLLWLNAPGAGACSGARAAHAVDRQAQAVYLVGEAGVLRVDLDALDIEAPPRAARTVARFAGAAAVAAAAWVTGVQHTSLAPRDARDGQLVVLRAVSRGGLALLTLRRNESLERTLARDGDIDAALERALDAQPVAGAWAPFRGTTFALRHVAALDGVRAAQELADGPADAALPLDVLAHGELARAFGARNVTAAADVLLRFNATGALSSARLVHVLPLSAPAVDVAFQWVPLAAHKQHANVLRVEGRVVAVFAAAGSAARTWTAARFACASCRQHERWDPRARACVCESGSAAVCVPCVAPYGCDTHRTVYNASAGACLVAARAAPTHERRCLPCGRGGAFFCPAPTRLEACPAERPVSRTRSGLAASSAACVCAQGERVSDAALSTCAACAPGEVCTPELAVLGQRLECPRHNTVLERRPGLEACVCAPGWFNASAARVPAGASGPRLWPALAELEGHALRADALAERGVEIELAECLPCPAGASCADGRLAPCPPGEACATPPRARCRDGFAWDGRQCAACDAVRTRTLCVRDEVVNCSLDDPPPRASAPTRLCPCTDGSDGGARVWTHAHGCRACRADHYCTQSPPVHGHHTETPCPRHAHAPPGSRALAACRCAAGRFMHNASCALCPAGAFCAGGALHACPAGTLSEPGAATRADCVCTDPATVLAADACACRSDLRNVSGACVPCANSRAERFDAAAGDSSECTACRPGFWRTLGAHVHAVLHAVQTGLADTHPFAHEARRAWAQFQRVYHNLTDARAPFCALCPPGFTCAGGGAAPEPLPAPPDDSAAALFAGVPAGAHAGAAALAPCPAPLPPGARRTAAYGLSSCFQEAATWQAAGALPDAAAFSTPALVRVDPRRHRAALISAVLNADSTELAALLDFVDLDSREPAVRRLATGEYEFVFEVDVVRLAYAYRDDLVALAAAMAPGDDGGVWAAALVPALWAAHHQARLAGTADCDLVLAHLVANAHARAAAAHVAAAAARRLGAPAPAPRFFAALDSLGLVQTSAQALVLGGGMLYVWPGPQRSFFAAQFRAHVAALPPPLAADAPAPLLAAAAAPSVAVECLPGTRSVALTSHGVPARLCRACPQGHFLHAGACVPCTSVYDVLVCARQAPRASRSATPCAWERNNGCSECPACAGCAYPPEALLELAPDFATNGLFDPLNSEAPPDTGPCALDPRP